MSDDKKALNKLDTWHHILFIRHGERADHAKHLNMEYPVRFDPPLTPLGVQQAKETGEFIREYAEKHGFDEIKLDVSPFLRTMMTASQIAKALGHSKIQINHYFCEWMEKMFFDFNVLPEIMSRRLDLYAKEEIIQNYLDGIEFIDTNIGFEEAMTYYPEP